MVEPRDADPGKLCCVARRGEKKVASLGGRRSWDTFWGVRLWSVDGSESSFRREKEQENEKGCGANSSN